MGFDSGWIRLTVTGGHKKEQVYSIEGLHFYIKNHSLFASLVDQ